MLEGPHADSKVDRGSGPLLLVLESSKQQEGIKDGRRALEGSLLLALVMSNVSNMTTTTLLSSMFLSKMLLFVLNRSLSSGWSSCCSAAAVSLLLCYFVNWKTNVDERWATTI